MMFLSNKTKTVKITEEFSLLLENKELITLLNEKGNTIPDNAKVYFIVPFGADYSGESIDIDVDNPIRIYWKIETIEK